MGVRSPCYPHQKVVRLKPANIQLIPIPMILDYMTLCACLAHIFLAENNKYFCTNHIKAHIWKQSWDFEMLCMRPSRCPPLLNLESFIGQIELREGMWLIWWRWWRLLMKMSGGRGECKDNYLWLMMTTQRRLLRAENQQGTMDIFSRGQKMPDPSSEQKD